jgi:hypothetical protein
MNKGKRLSKREVLRRGLAVKHRLKAEGRCVGCGGNQGPLVTGTLCGVCRGKAKERRDRRLRRLTAAGKCIACGVRKAEKGTAKYRRCRKCRAEGNVRFAKYMRERYRRLKEEGKAKVKEETALYRCGQCGIGWAAKGERCKTCTDIYPHLEVGTIEEVPLPPLIGYRSDVLLAELQRRGVRGLGMVVEALRDGRVSEL